MNNRGVDAEVSPESGGMDENTLISRVAMCIALFLCCIVGGCTVYEMQSSTDGIAAKRIDQETQKQDLEFRKACVQSGGNWVPVMLGEGQYASTNMSCVHGPLDTSKLRVAEPPQKNQ